MARSALFLVLYLRFVDALIFRLSIVYTNIYSQMCKSLSCYHQTYAALSIVLFFGCSQAVIERRKDTRTTEYVLVEIEQ